MSHLAGADLAYILLIQFMVSVCFAVMMSLFLEHIFHVVLMCAEKQMILSYTTRVVTCMENVLFTGTFAMVQLPCNTRCKLIASID